MALRYGHAKVREQEFTLVSDKYLPRFDVSMENIP
jgi:hypothetical protein